MPRYVICLFATALLALAGCHSGLTTVPRATVTVPDVVGDSVTAATAALAGVQLTLGAQNTASSATVPAGDIISQDPAAGASAPSGSAVGVVVSTGPASTAVTVPSVVGDTVAAATTALTMAQLTLGTQTTASSPTVPSGDVISQNPAAGASVASGSPVSVVVSTGPAAPVMVAVPNIVGDTVAAATTALTGAGLTLGTQMTASSATVPAGDVISQNPPAAASVATGSAVSVVVSTGPAATASVVYSLTGVPNAANPSAALIQGSDGNFYGTAYGGTVGIGSIFELTPAGAETVLYSFTSAVEGDGPNALVQGSDGNFYGTTSSGGAGNEGTVFRLTPAGVLTQLHAFTESTGDGTSPQGPLILASDGNIYGTTEQGGTTGNGTVHRVAMTGAVTVIYSFGANGASDAASPLGGVIEGSDGNFYGTSDEGGATNHGTVFRLTPAGTETVLYSFTGANGDGAHPWSPLVAGSDGNFYGTTAFGGNTALNQGNGAGTVFRVTPSGTESVLYTFTGNSTATAQQPIANNDAVGPTAGLVIGADGNFYGVSSYGGTDGLGTFFQVTPAGQETVIHSFVGGTGDGAIPQGLLEASDGHIYGTTDEGGPINEGTVFKD
jgi:uncharacterized repeat protein (TIGR03803 family)